jgi:crotonobetainyl-CoA:carnitine CoA-transferase CaiB-like acyl-CoA transferase
MTDTNGPRAPLTGLRVLDLTNALAGPYGTRILGDLGAEVIKVDTRVERQYLTQLDLAARLQAMYPNGDPGDEPWNTGGAHGQLNRNKSSIALDLASPDERERFLRLVETADCLVENFTPKVMPSLGLSYEELKVRNPALVYVAMPGFGSSGPRSMFPAFAPTTEAASGFLSMVGYEDGTLVPNPMSLADFVGGLNAMVGLMGALWNTRRTGEGAFVDLSQVEAMASFAGEEFQIVPDWSRDAETGPHGNQLPCALLSGVFPSRGFDEWIAISLYSELEVRAIGDVLGGPTLGGEWAALSRSPAGRDRIRAELSARTAAFGKLELATTLQMAGIGAAPVQTAPDLLADPQLNHLGFFIDVDAPGVGPFPYEGPPWHFDHWSERLTSPAPRVGEDTARILQALDKSIGDNGQSQTGGKD